MLTCLLLPQQRNILVMPNRIIFPEKGQVALQRFELPAPGPLDVSVRTLYSLMSIGTETIILHQRYDPDTHFAKMFSFPQLQTGVQAVGEIEAVGNQVAGLKVGDRVFMRMAHGSHQVQPAGACSRVPEGIDLKAACWCGLAKTAYRAAAAAPFTKDAHVLIIGAGPVGQMAIRWASTVGVRTIASVDLSDIRLKHAEMGGANLLLPGGIAEQIDRVKEINAGKGPSVIVDATGNADVFKHALAAASMFSKVLLLGDTGYPGRQRLTSDVMSKGLSVQAVHDSHDFHGGTQQEIDARFFASVQAGQFDLSGLITHEYSPVDCAYAYQLADQQREDVMGLLYDWNQVD